jgi:hypothetical protein
LHSSSLGNPDFHDLLPAEGAFRYDIAGWSIVVDPRRCVGVASGVQVNTLVLDLAVRIVASHQLELVSQ